MEEYLFIGLVEVEKSVDVFGLVFVEKYCYDSIYYFIGVGN